MSGLHRFFRLALLLILVTAFGLPISAQDGPALTAGQPTAVNVSAPGEVIRLTYNLTSARAVTLQALSQNVPPVLTLLRDDVVVAEQPNVEAALIVTLDAFLPAGDYVIEVRAPEGNSATGTVILAVQSDMPMVPLVLNAGVPLVGEVSAQLPVALYAFDRLDTPAYLYIDSMLVESGIQATLVNLQTGQTSAALTPDLPGARLTIPAGIGQYQLEISFTETGAAQPFALCLEAVASGACVGGSTVTPPPTPAPQTPQGCFVTPSFPGGANIRQSASTNAPVLTGLPGGASADVIGISPDGTWYNVIYNGVNGWAAQSATVASGTCANVPVIAPPVIPTAIPPTPAPTVQAQPTPSGPCVVRFNAPELVYTQPTAIADWIYDQVPSGGEIIPTGRWNSDPSWYKTNYAGAWWQNRPGTAGVLSGNCAALPLIPWP
jgi:hypothetical protein